MGLFDEVAGGLLKQVFSNPSTQKALLGIIMGLLTDSRSKGFDGMAQRFDEKGLGDIMSSWIGKGENLPISPEQIGKVLGNDQVQQVAQRLGISTDEASIGLAELLPQVVDKLTPEGSLPNDDLLRIAEKLLGR